MNNEIKEMARLMENCYKMKMTCDECIVEGKKMFGDNSKCALIEYAVKLHNAGYRKQGDTVKEFAERLGEYLHKKIELDNKVAEKASIVCISKYHSTIPCQSVIDLINELLAEYGVEVE